MENPPKGYDALFVDDIAKCRQYVIKELMPLARIFKVDVARPESGPLCKDCYEECTHLGFFTEYYRQDGSYEAYEENRENLYYTIIPKLERFIKEELEECPDYNAIWVDIGCDMKSGMLRCMVKLYVQTNENRIDEIKDGLRYLVKHDLDVLLAYIEEIKQSL